MIPVLPQADSAPGKRESAIAKARESYRWNYEYVAPLPFVDEVPKADKPDKKWLLKVAKELWDITMNSREIMAQSRNHSVSTGIKSARRLHKKTKKGGAKGVLDHLLEVIEMGAGEITATSLDDYDVLYQTFREPLASRWCHSDFYFAHLRLGGPNPMMLHGIEKVPEKFEVENFHFQASMGEHDSLERAGAEGRLFMCDYAGFVDFECGTFPHGRQKYVGAPMALFAMPPGDYDHRFLIPVAIQLQQGHSPVVIPKDGTHAWQIAKSWANCADGNYHQAITHLAHTHLVIEPFVIAMHRNMAPNHPLFVLLNPHFNGTLEINDAAQSSLIAPEGGVDAVLAGTIEASRAAAAAGWKEFHFNDRFPRKELAARQVDDSTRLPEYPYRDDALLLWDAIHDWVEAYVKVYYADDSTVQKDSELQAWIAEVLSKDGGRMRDVGEDGGVETAGYLVDMVTMLIFTAGPQHAAVNFPQLELMSFAPFYPLACYAPLPEDKDGLTQQHWLNMMPPLDMAQYQMILGNLLGEMRYTTLGDYPESWIPCTGKYFKDERVVPAIKAFNKRLDEIEHEIDYRNSLRTYYKYLKPSLVPQSINI